MGTGACFNGPPNRLHGMDLSVKNVFSNTNVLPVFHYKADKMLGVPS
jgi:hypothetical protein